MSTNRRPEEGEFARRTAELYDVSDDYVNDITFIKQLMADTRHKPKKLSQSQVK